MGFIDAIQACFSKYFTFSGRARRPEYWWFYLFIFVVTFIASFIDAILSPMFELGEDGEILSLVRLIVSLGVIVPFFAVSWRRMHDTGWSGWMTLSPVFGFVMIILSSLLVESAPGIAPVLLFSGVAFMVVMSIVVFVLSVRRSQVGANDFGPEPPVGG
ncbi:MAG: DUF805 domain-containing protein [Pseudomonadota bacterium]